MSTFAAEVGRKQRFEFGKNWRSFLSTLTDERIEFAETSLQRMLRVENLNRKTVLDIGSGSGLSSLVMRRMGAELHSFDFDPESVACTRELRDRYFPDDPNWVVEEGSVLDEGYLRSLGRFDIVYSWGVLHHTGDMWTALTNAASRVKPDGTLFISIYNDQGTRSKVWTRIKRMYCSGFLGRTVITGIFGPYFVSRVLLSCIRKRENLFAGYKKRRGMSITHDWFDWLGGYPFEVASVEQVVRFFEDQGFRLDNSTTTTSLGTNQFVFGRKAVRPSAAVSAG